MKTVTPVFSKLLKGEDTIIDKLNIMSKEKEILLRIEELEAKMDDVYGHDHSDDILIRFIEKPSIDDADLYVRNIPEEVRNGVTSIGDYVFQHFQKLEEAYFPNAVSVGECSFNGCISLTEVSFPETIVAGTRAFSNCESLLSADFPKLEVIPNGGFMNDEVLVSINFPVATIILENAFNGCTGLTEVSFPEVTEIGISAFQGADSLTELDFPKATKILGNAFKECNSLVDVEFPEVTSVLANAFESCAALETVSLPKVSSLGVSAFHGCSSLREVNLPAVDSVGNTSFTGNSSITSITLPEDKTFYIGHQAFKNCSNLVFSDDLTVRIPSGGTNSYAAGDCPEVFYGCSKLKKIHVTDTDILPAFCFTNCTSLEEVQFDGTAANTRAFNGCRSLKKVIAPNLDHFNGDQNYGNFYEFTSAKELSRANLPKATWFGPNTFYDSGLNDAYFPMLERITGSECFRANPLKWVYLPNYLGTTANNHDLPEGTFRYCGDLEYVLLPKITNVIAYNFIGCKKLKLLGLPFVTRYERQYTGEGYEYAAPFSQTEAGNEPQVQYVDYRLATSVPTLTTKSKNPAKAHLIFPGWYDTNSNKIPTKYIVPDSLYDAWIVNSSFVDSAADVVKQSVFEADPNHPEYPWVTDPTILEHYFDLD